MPITLNTPFAPGDFDPGKSYDKVKVVSFTLDLFALEFRFTVARGYADGEGWHWAKGSAGEMLATDHTVRDQPEVEPAVDENGDPVAGTGVAADPQFSILVSKLVGSDPNKTIYDRAAEEIYTWIIANVPAYAGTID